MTYFITLVTFLMSTAIVFVKANGYNTDVHAAVLSAFDATKSYSENYYTILDALCPTSVYCESTESSDNRTAGVQQQATGSPNNSNLTLISASVIDALAFLRFKSSSLNGCCSRCSCENDCLEKTTCCTMMNITSLSNNVIQEPEVMQECVIARIQSYIPGSELSKLDAQSLGYYMVNDCFGVNVDATIANKCRHPNTSFLEEVTPAYSFVTGRNYKNRFCAECNRDLNITLWDPVIIFHSYISLTGLVTIPSSADELYKLSFSSKLITFIYQPPESAQPITPSHRCLSMSDKDSRIGADMCDNFSMFTEAQNAVFKKACAFESNALPFETLLHTFTNVFCFLCYDLRVIDVGGRFDSCNSAQKFTPLSLYAVLHMDETRSGSIPNNDVDGVENMCKCTEYSDIKQGLCRQLICPPGEHFVGCQCRQFLTRITGLTVMVYLDILPAERRAAAKLDNLIGNNNSRRSKNVMSKVVQLLNSTWGPLVPTGWILYRETSVSDDHLVKLYNILVLKMQNKIDNRHLMTRMLNWLHEGLTTTILNVPVRICLGRILRLHTIGTVSTVVFDDDPDVAGIKRELLVTEQFSDTHDKRFLPYTQPLSKTVLCRRVKLQASEVELLHNQSLAGLSSTYLDYVYSKKDDSMCLDDFETLFIKSKNESSQYCLNCVYFLITIFVAIWILSTIL